MVNIPQRSQRVKTQPIKCALEYAARGWPVFPLHGVYDGICLCRDPRCPHPGKHSLVRRGLKDATTETERISEWWNQWPDANVGIRTGRQDHGGAGFFALDVDPRHGGDDTLESRRDQYGRLPDTIEVFTGGGGRHLWFATSQTVLNSTGIVGTGLDIRGDGGYVVAPESNHISGRRYCFEASSDPESTPIAEPPDWLTEHLATKGRRGLVADEKPIPMGRRNSTLTSLAGTMRAAGFTVDAIRAALLEENEQRCRPPLPTREVENIARSIGSYPPGAARAIGEWERIDAILRGKSLGSMEKVLIILEHHRNTADESYPTERTIADLSGLAVSTVSETIKRLKAAGRIIGVEQFRLNGRGRIRNRYLLPEFVRQTEHIPIGGQINGQEGARRR